MQGRTTRMLSKIHKIISPAPARHRKLKHSPGYLLGLIAELLARLLHIICAVDIAGPSEIAVARQGQGRVLHVALAW